MKVFFIAPELFRRKIHTLLTDTSNTNEMIYTGNEFCRFEGAEIGFGLLDLRGEIVKNEVKTLLHAAILAK